MRKHRSSTPPKPYAEMTDAEYRKAVKDEFGYDPLSPDQPKVHITQYTGTAKLLEQIKQGTKVQNQDLVRELVLWLAQAVAGFDPDMRGEILYAVATKLHDSVKRGRKSAETQKGKKRAAALHSQWQQMANGYWAKNRSLSKRDVGKLIKRKLGGKTDADTVRKKIVKPKMLATDVG